MVLQSDAIDDLVRGFRNYGEPDRERQDADERALGGVAMRGIIIGVEDAATGSVLVRTTTRAEIPASIVRHRYPMPRTGDEVKLSRTIDRRIVAEPIGPELPMLFTARVISTQGSSNPDEVHGGIVEHAFPNIGGTRRVFALAAKGVTMEVNADPDLSTQVACGIFYTALVAETDLIDHQIIAMFEIPNPLARS